MTDLKSEADCLNHLLEKNGQHLEVYQERKLDNEKNSPLDWEEDNVLLVIFPLIPQVLFSFKLND